MKKILSIIGFLLLISCSSGDVSPQEKSKSQKQQDTPALNLRPIEQLSPDVQKPNPPQKREPSKRGTDSAYEAAIQRDVQKVLDSLHSLDSMR